jgi:hypothetical protein
VLLWVLFPQTQQQQQQQQQQQGAAAATRDSHWIPDCHSIHKYLTAEAPSHVQPTTIMNAAILIPTI